MAELLFECLGAKAEPYAAVPTIMLRLRLTETTGEPIHTVALHCQLRIEPQRRRYSAAEPSRLLDLFGEPARWGETLKPLLFANLSTTVPGFSGVTEIDLAVPCTYDFDVAATKYFHALDGGEIPLLLLFSGTVFAHGENGLSVTPVSWGADAQFRLPVRVWRDVMDIYFPNSAWIRLERETLDALHRFRSEQAVTSWDATIAALLDAAGASPPVPIREEVGA